MALTDSLTGLANHRAFMDYLDQAHSLALRLGTGLQVIFGDVNRFKTINDTYGHATGDSILCQVADRLRDYFRAQDTIGRLGGDEFAILCEDVTADTYGMISRLGELVAIPYSMDRQLITTPVSVEAARLRPDVVVMDLGLPDVDGLTATRQILDDTPDSHIIVIETTTGRLDRFIVD